jgi:hypothetical protein
VVIPSQARTMLALLGRAIGNDRGVDRHGDSDHRLPRRDPPRSSAIVVMAARRKRWTVGLVPSGLQAVMVAGAGQIRKNLDVLSKTFLLMASGPGRGGQPRAAHVSHVYGVQRRSTSGGYRR